ncbi:MAG: DUF1292 domain-containing protein [Eubacteriales bacterium]|nr:DUF1292 domain-containing protein [Eubacteriales bacterium]
MEKISFRAEDGQVEEFYVEEQTTIGGRSYLLVSDSMDDEANAYVLKDVSSGEGDEACYEMVEDDEELDAVFKIFQEMMEDVDLTK